YQYCVGRSAGGGDEVARMPGRINAVHSNKDFASAEAARLHCIGHLLTRRLLRFGRDRILEVENHAIGRQRFRLLERAGIGTRHIEHTAARTDRHCVRPPQLIQPTVGATRMSLFGKWAAPQKTCGWRGSTVAPAAGSQFSSALQAM